MVRHPLDDLPYVPGSDRINEILIWGNLISVMLETYFLQFAFQASQHKAFLRKQEISQQNEELEAQQSKLQDSLDEIQSIVSYTVHSGNFDRRLRIEGKTGHWKTLSETINQLFESIVRPLQMMTFMTKDLADGNLANIQTEEAEGEMGKLSGNLSTSIDSLNHLLLGVKDQAQFISKSSKAMLDIGQSVQSDSMEITASMDEISEGARSQVNQVDESSDLIRKLVSLSEEIDRQSQAINNASLHGVEKSETGVTAVESLKENIESVNHVTQETVEAMNALNERISAITKILSFMNDISAQTNLLALNAAIEAAQAGDAGRGFGIIAEEIRKLADDSKKGLREIEGLITGVRESAKTTDEKIKDISKHLVGGQQATESSNVAFEEVSASCRHTLEISQAILQAAQQQSEKASSAMGHIQQVVVVAEQTATGTERARSAARGLSESVDDSISKSKEFAAIAEQLDQKIAQFKLNESASKEGRLLIKESSSS